MVAKTKQKSLSLLLKNYGGFFIFICFFLDLLEWKNLNELE